MNVPVIMGLTELEETGQLLKEILQPWAGDLEKYSEPVEREIHWTALPALTVAINRHFAGHNQRGSYLAAIFSLLFMADYIGCQVKDDEEGQEYNRDLQFAILIADLIFGQAVKLLSSINGHGLLGILTDMMCIINEGHVMRRLSVGGNDQEILAREKASFYKYSFLAAARASGCGALECKFYEDLGYDAGMAVTLYDSGMKTAGLAFLERVKSLLAGYKSYNNENSPLPWLLDEILGRLEFDRAAAAI